MAQYILVRDKETSWNSRKIAILEIAEGLNISPSFCVFVKCSPKIKKRT